MFIEK